MNIFIPGMMIPKRDCTELILKSDGRIYIRADLEDGEHVIPTEHYATEINCQPADIPAADVRPVVLCRDCKWFGEKKDSLRGCCALLGIYPAKDWYCAFGTKLTNCGADMSGGGEE